MLAQEIVELALVVSLAGLESLDHEHAREAELTARERPRPRCLDGHATRRHHSPTQLLAGLGIDDRDRAGENDPGTDERTVADAGAFDDHRAAADDAVVADDDRRGLRGFEDTTDADASRKVHVGPDLGTGTDGGPRVDHGVRAHPGADVHVARHQDHARLEEGAVASGRTRNDAHAVPGVVALQRDLVGILEGADFGGLHRRLREQQQDRLLHPLVHHHRVVDHFGDAQLAPVEPGDHAHDQLSRVRSGRLGAPFPQLFDLALKVAHRSGGYWHRL